MLWNSWDIKMIHAIHLPQAHQELPNFPVVFIFQYLFRGFLGISAGNESAGDAGDPGSSPGLGRSPGAGIGYPLQYFWVSLMAQKVKKNLPAVWETWVRSLGWEDPLEGMATNSSILAWRILMDRGTWQAIVHGVTKSQTRLSD